MLCLIGVILDEDSDIWRSLRIINIVMLESFGSRRGLESGFIRILFALVLNRKFVFVLDLGSA